MVDAVTQMSQETQLNMPAVKGPEGEMNPRQKLEAHKAALAAEKLKRQQARIEKHGDGRNFFLRNLDALKNKSLQIAGEAGKATAYGLSEIGMRMDDAMTDTKLFVAGLNEGAAKRVDGVLGARLDKIQAKRDESQAQKVEAKAKSQIHLADKRMAEQTKLVEQIAKLQAELAEKSKTTDEHLKKASDMLGAAAEMRNVSEQHRANADYMGGLRKKVFGFLN